MLPGLSAMGMKVKFVDKDERESDPNDLAKKEPVPFNMYLHTIGSVITQYIPTSMNFIVDITEARNAGKLFKSLVTFAAAIIPITYLSLSQYQAPHPPC